jgi:hypothetical protein
MSLCIFSTEGAKSIQLVIHENIEEHMEWHLGSKKEMVDLLARFLKNIIHPDVRKKFGACAAPSI